MKQDFLKNSLTAIIAGAISVFFPVPVMSFMLWPINLIGGFCKIGWILPYFISLAFGIHILANNLALHSANSWSSPAPWPKAIAWVLLQTAILLAMYAAGRAARAAVDWIRSLGRRPGEQIGQSFAPLTK